MQEAGTTVELFVNGTLMRGDVLHGNLDGARFVGEARTAPRYRLFSIGDVHPGMIEANGTAEPVSVAGEVYELTLEHLQRLIAGEPPGLGVAVVELAGGERRLGIFWVAAELPDTAIDISHHGDWRVYRAAQAGAEKEGMAVR
jgi:adenine/guanine/hypoxanthine permease